MAVERLCDAGDAVHTVSTEGSDEVGVHVHVRQESRFAYDCTENTYVCCTI